MSYDIGPKIGIEGEAEFRHAISSIESNLKTLGTEMKAVTSAYDKNDNSVEKLTAQNGVLEKQISDQKMKLEGLKSMLSESSAKYGEADEKTEAWQRSVNNATAELNKMERELGSNKSKIADADAATDKLGDETKQLGNEMDNAGKKTSVFGDVLKATLVNDVIMGGIRAIGSAIQEAFNKFKELASGAMETADNLEALSSETGLTTEQLQVMQYVGDDLGVSLDTQTGALSKLVKNMSGAKDGTGTAADAFKQLEISVTDSNGQLRDSNDVYKEALSALGGVGNETERDAMAMALFGKSARELNPLIEAGADGLSTLEQQAKDTGAIMSDKAVAALDSMGDSMDHLKQSAQTAAGMFVAQFAPALTDVTTGFAKLLNGKISIDEFMAQVNTLVTQITGAITSALPNIIAVGGTILTALLNGIVAALPDIIPAAVDLVVQFGEAIITNLPLLVEAALEIIIELANSIAESLPTLIPTIVDVVITIVETLIDHVDELIDASIAIMIALAEGLIAALPKLIEKAPEIIIKLLAAIIENVPKLLGASAKIIATLVSGLASLPAKMIEVGENLVTGLWNGISNKVQWLYSKISAWTSSVVSYIKKLFGVHSPSTVMAGIGGYISEGLANGITGKVGLVRSAMNALSGEITGSQSLNASINVGKTSGYSLDAGSGYYTSNIYMDSVLVASQTSKAQYRKNAIRARSYGVVPA